MPDPTYPKVLDANGCPIDFQGVQKVRNYQMPIMEVVALTADGTAFPTGIPRAIFATTAGTATIVDAAGNTVASFPFSAGRNDVAVSAMSSATSLGNIFGGY